MTLYGVDISNLQGPPETYRNQQWYKDADFVIVQAIRPPAPYEGWQVGGYTLTQLKTAREDGKKVGIYVWLWNGLADVAADINARLSIIPDDFPLDLRTWVDVEDETNLSVFKRHSAVDIARQTVDAWLAKRGDPPSGGYSRDEYITDFLGGYWPDGWVYWQASGGSNPEELLPARPMRQFYLGAPVDRDSLLESDLIIRNSETTVISTPVETPVSVARETPDDYPSPTWRESAIAYRGALDSVVPERDALKQKLISIRNLTEGVQ